MKTEEDLKAIIESLQLPFEIAPLQFLDVMQAYHAGRFALFYDVGGGKTLVATLIAKMFGYPTVIAMPHILLKQWERWLKRARVPESDLYIYYGPKRDKAKLKTARWVMTSHAIFRKDSKIFMEAYKGRKVTFLLDEAQVIKDIRTKIYQAVKGFVSADNPLVLMTATPTAKPEDTYAYMSLKSPGLYRSKTHWDSIHIGSVDIFGAITSYNNMELLRNNFAINAAKRDKKDLFGHNLEPVLDPIVYDLSPAHYKLYKRLVEEQLLLLDDGTKIDATTPQKLRHALQQVVWNPARFSGDPDDVAAGFELLETLCEQVDFMDKSKSKFVIWTYYRSTSEAVYAWMREKFGDTGVIAYGGGDASKSVEKIMFDDSTRWMIANPLSVGAGLELQHVCWEMFFAEIPTSPIPVRQSCGRVDRPGQKYKPTIRFGQASGTVQVSLFKDLLRNDERASYVERTRSSIRDDLLGQGRSA